MNCNGTCQYWLLLGMKMYSSHEHKMRLTSGEHPHHFYVFYVSPHPHANQGGDVCLAAMLKYSLTLFCLEGGEHIVPALTLTNYNF